MTKVGTPAPMAMTLSDFNDMRQKFKDHYYLAGCNDVFGGQDIQVPWDDFSAAVMGFAKRNSVSESDIAVRFVHCYSTGDNVLYLRMQILTMTPNAITPDTYDLNAKPCDWYKLANGTMASTTETTLFDADYLSYFYYCTSGSACTTASLDNLASDTNETKYARNVTMPWTLELAQIYADNSAPSDATLCFGAGAPVDIATPAVVYQHTLLAYLRDSEGTPLMDDNLKGLPFQMKAGDMGTLCPPVCGVYVLPQV